MGMLLYRKNIAKNYPMLLKGRRSPHGAQETVLAANLEPLQKRVNYRKSSDYLLIYKPLTVTLNVGDVPIINVSDRKWNDDSIAVTLGLKLPPGAS